MPLSDEQAHRLEQWLNSRGIRFNCPICGSTQWETGEIVTAANMSGHGDVLPMPFFKDNSSIPRDRIGLAARDIVCCRRWRWSSVQGGCRAGP